MDTESQHPYEATTAMSPSREEAVRALESIVLDRVVDEVDTAAHAVPLARKDYDSHAIRHETLASVSEIIPTAAREAIELAVSMEKEGFNRDTALIKLAPMAVREGLVDEVVVHLDDYHRDEFFGKVVSLHINEDRTEDAFAALQESRSTSRQAALLGRMADRWPEETQRIHVAILDLQPESDEKYKIQETATSQCRALMHLLPHTPEVVADIAQRVDAVRDEHERVAIRSKLAEYDPQMGVKAVADFKAIRSSGSMMSRENDQKRYQEAVDDLKGAARVLTDQGHIEEAVEIAGAFQPGTQKELLADIVDHLLDRGEPLRAVEIAQSLSNNEHVAVSKRALPSLTAEHQDSVLSIIREKGGVADLVDAANILPGLLAEAEAAVAAARSSFDRSGQQRRLAPALIDAGRFEEVIGAVRGIDKDYAAFSTLVNVLTPNLPTRLPEALEIVNACEYADLRAELLSRLAPFSPEAAQEAVRLFEAQIAPGMAEKAAEARQAGDGYQMPNQTRAMAIVDNLARAGFTQEAVRVANGLVTSDAYTKAVIGFAAETPEVLSRLMKSIEHARTTEQFDVAEQLVELIGTLPDSELDKVVAGLSGAEKPAMRLIAAEAMYERLIEGGRVQELLELLPSEIGDERAMEGIVAALAEIGNIDSVRAIVDRISDSRGDLNTQYRRQIDLLIPLVDTIPELAQDIYKLYGEYKPYGASGRTLAAIMPYVPEAADLSLSYMQQMKDAKYSEIYPPEQERKAMVDLAEGLIKADRGGEAIAMLSGYVLQRNGDFYRHELMPALIEQGDMGLALQVAREMRSPSDRADALVLVAMARDMEVNQDNRSIMAELVGEDGIESDPHTRSDRSINYSYFASEIATNPLLVETFMSRASTPAELLAVLRAVDVAAEGSSNGSQLQAQALMMLKRYDTTPAMIELWKQERETQALGGEKADHKGFKDLPKLVQLSRNLEATESATTLYRLFDQGYTAASLLEHPWLVNGEIIALGEDIFPVEGSKAQQHEWLADHSFVKLEGFNKRSIGQIISNRLANNCEGSLHDASQWLEGFRLDDEHARVDTFNASTGQIETKVLVDYGEEIMCLSKMLHTTFSADDLRRLPGFASAGGEMDSLKTQKFDQLFSSSAHRLIYAATLQALAQSSTQSTTKAEVSELINAWAASGLIKEWAGRGKEIINEGTLVERAQEVLAKRINASMHDPEEKLPMIIGQLKTLGQERKEYLDASTTWIRNYQNLPAQKLSRVWGERQHAIADGVPDQPDAIYEWSLAAGLRKYYAGKVDEKGELPGGIPARELLSRFSSFVPELATRYDSSRTGAALERLWTEHTQEADLTPLSIELADGYTFKVFSKDDPAGMTIGYDTNCCMTLGGASEDCIYAGYSDRRFGFVGLYDEQQKLVAQSFVWHADGVLVLDNIEGQRGRNLERIQGQYKDALGEYLVRLHSERPELGIRQVNLGTGYLNNQLAKGLDNTTAVRIPLNVYTDSDSQLKLLELSPEAIEQISQHEVVLQSEVHPTAIVSQPVREPQAEIVAIASAIEGAEAVSRIEAQVYPSELTLGHADIRADLERPDNYSFMIGSRSGNSGLVGYVLAYKDEKEGGVYVSDMALLPTEQRAGYGTAALDHLLSQVAEAREDCVVFEARESTSYHALQSEVAKNILAKYGYTIRRSEKMEGYFDNGESAYRVELARDLVPA